MSTENEMLIMAEHQLLGYHEAKYGLSLLALVDNMGLSISEFEKLNDTGQISFMAYTDIVDIALYLERKYATMQRQNTQSNEQE